MPRITPFSPGQRWYVDRGPNMSFDKPNYWFVVLGPSHNGKVGAKLCHMLPDYAPFEGNDSMLKRAARNNNFGDFDTKHLKKYAVLHEQTPEALEVSHQIAQARYAGVINAMKAYYNVGFSSATSARRSLQQGIMDVLNGTSERCDPRPILESVLQSSTVRKDVDQIQHALNVLVHDEQEQLQQTMAEASPKIRPRRPS